MPDTSGTSPLMHFNMLVFPEPFLPTSAIFSLSDTEKFISESTVLPSYSTEPLIISILIRPIIQNFC